MTDEEPTPAQALASTLTLQVDAWVTEAEPALPQREDEDE